MVKLIKNYFLIFSFLFVPLACENNLKVYKEVLNNRIEKGDFNGNVLVLEKGNLVLKSAHGLSNIETGDSLQLGSIFRLGSVSKQFTAMAIAILQENGKLSYEQNIKDIIPELPYDGITIEHLLQHTSGLPDYLNLMLNNWRPELKEDDSKRYISGNMDIIQMIVEKAPPIHFEPDEKWEYSNTGYILLATVVERVSGKSFEQFLHDKIFEPSKMKSTSVYSYVKGPDSSMPKRVFGYSRKGNDFVPNDAHFLNFAKGDGGIYSTLEDLLKWDRILYKHELVSKKTIEKIFTAGTLKNGESFDYGFGWFLKNATSGNKIVYHGGGWVGFGNYIYRDISNNSSFIILTNNSNWAEVEGIVEKFEPIMSNSK